MRLGDFGKPGNCFERQLAHLDRQYRASPSGAVPEIEALFDWLKAQNFARRAYEPVADD